MLLKDIMPINCNDLGDIEITGITCNSRQVKKGFAFVCINGVNVDGHKFAKMAEEGGASVIIAERDCGCARQIIVSDTRFVYAKMCANWFGNPSRSLKLIGVTGTNGKTSTTYMIKSILESAGHKTGLVGTIQNMIGDRVVEARNTTPEAYELNSLFADMKAEGCEFCVMEISSHALHQHRICDLEFSVAAFTNLTQDHLDYHGTMENYLEAKKMLFSMCKTAVINIDDKYSEQLTAGLECDILTYSLGNNSDFSAKDIKYFPDGAVYELLSHSGINRIKVNTSGKFSVYNSMCAAVCANAVGIDFQQSAKALSELSGVKGRAEVVPTGRDFTVVIDYAHTPDGLKNILSSFKDYDKNRLVVLFGCGGDRDRTKRAIMGKVAVYNADFVIVTSDNPRSEEPMAIINDILEGTKAVNTPVKVIENRIEAIKYAISTAQPNDIIVLAGKGHETYQILKDKTIHLDEREVIKEALSES